MPLASRLINSLFTTVENLHKSDPSCKMPPEVYIGFYSMFGSVFTSALDLLDRCNLVVKLPLTSI